MASNGTNWYFTKEQLENSPSKQCGIDGGKELSFRQQAANFIQDMGQKLKVSQLCINTAIVYMHRFYVFHSFTRFPWNTIAAAAVLLAAKVEEQPRKLEHVIRVVNLCKNPNDKTFDTTSEKYLYQLQDLIFNENILLQTLGFEVAIDHPHTHVVRCCHLVRATKDLAHTSYFMASNSLHLTTMCLQYKPTVVACFCIHFVCKWANWEIPLSNEKKQWFSYVDETVTSEILEQLANDFLAIYENCPSRLKEKIVALGEGLAMPQNTGASASPFASDKKPVTFSHSESNVHKIHYSEMKSFTADEFKHRSMKQVHNEAGSSGQHHDREREYRDKKEREQAGHHFKPPLPNAASSKHGQTAHGHDHHTHASSGDPKLNKVARPQAVSSNSVHSSVVKSDGKDVLASSVNQQLVRDKRDYNNVYHKPSSTDVNNLNSRSNSAEKLNSGSKTRPSADPKLQPRHRDESKIYNNKLENDIKKHLSAAIHDKSIISTSQKIASETNKSVPVSAVIKQEVHNNNGNVLNHSTSENTVKHDVPIKEEPNVVVPPIIKRPSLFSPEKTPPSLKRSRTKTPPSSGKKSLESEFSLGGIKRSRTSSTTSTNSTNSEPELRPVMKKIDQVEGFESLMHDSSIGINAAQQIPNAVSPDSKTAQNVSIAKELKPPDLIPPFNSNSGVTSQPIMNGIETTPSLISNLLKEAPTIPHLPVVTSNETSKEHRERKKSKKEKHKHRSKEKHREDKEKKRKHKDKDKEKHRHRHQEKEATGTIPTPIKITIPKDKIHNSDSSTAPVLGGLKIKIPKDRIKTDTIGETSVSSLSTTSSSGGSLKIKISKDVINNFNNNSDVNNKKRDRSKDASLMVTTTSAPSKVYKSNHSRLSDSRNSKNSYHNQVMQLGDDKTSVLHRLAESKYINKGATT